MIRASRKFVNVRLNPWLDKLNHRRELALLGEFGGADDQQNTVLCLFEPDAPGMSADAFPTESSIAFGTRPGKRYLFLADAEGHSIEQLRESVTAYREAQTGGKPADPEIVDRIVWEYKAVSDGTSLGALMERMAAELPRRKTKGPPRLPAMPDLVQALNIAAADSRAVLAIVRAQGGGEEIERKVARLVFEEGIAGRTHVALMTTQEWTSAHECGRIRGGATDPGVYFVAPDPFGLDGEVWSEIAPDASEAHLREELVAALERFQREWRKLDRKSHIWQGRRDGLTWSEFDPDARAVVPIGPGSAKLGRQKLDRQEARTAQTGRD